MSVNSNLKRAAFTLLELMIVVMIMGVVYTLVVHNFSRLKEQSTKITLKNLKIYLNNIPHEKSVKLLCLDDCSSCDVFVDGSSSKTIENFLDDSVITYRYEFNYGFTKVEPDVFFNKDDVEESVCFSYEVDENGVGDQVLVEYKDKFYDYIPYFHERVVYNSMADAGSAMDDLAKEVIR